MGNQSLWKFINVHKIQAVGAEVLSLATLREVQSGRKDNREAFLKELGKLPVAGIMSLMDYAKAKGFAEMLGELSLKDCGSLLLFNKLKIRNAGENELRMYINDNDSLAKKLTPCHMGEEKKDWIDAIYNKYVRFFGQIQFSLYHVSFLTVPTPCSLK